jgi:hypothetical protein
LNAPAAPSTYAYLTPPQLRAKRSKTTNNIEKAIPSQSIRFTLDAKEEGASNGKCKKTVMTVKAITERMTFNLLTNAYLDFKISYHPITSCILTKSPISK